MEQFAIGAFAAMSATLFTNPLEVVKTRFQLQGELQAKGKHAVHYKNFFHAFYTIIKTDGMIALQQGLTASLWHQFFMNGIRLGGFQFAEEHRLNYNANGEKSVFKTAIIAGVMGAITAVTGSPFFLVKVQLQAKSSDSIAVGTQHNIQGTFSTLRQIYRLEGIRGLWRGCGGSVPRRIVGSATQLTSFGLAKDLLANNQVFQIKKGYCNAIVASSISGAAVTLLMNPLDTISTRLYNQGVDKEGRGRLYSSYFDCVSKIVKNEGFSGFYKGVVPLYIRTGPQTVLVLLIWDTSKDFIKNLKLS